MLGKIDLGQILDKKTYKSEIKNLEEKLLLLQQAIQIHKIPVMIAFEGFSASGKGTAIARLVYPLDPRHFNVYTMNKIQESEVMRPFLWSYWVNSPERGRITLLDKSWHRAILPEGIEKWKLTQKEKTNFHYDVNAFERQLSDDGTVIIKLFLHISKEEQEKRFRELEKNADTKWRIDAEDWEQNKFYDKYLNLFEHMISHTNTNENPWHIIEANDRRFAIVKIYKIIIERLEQEIRIITEKRLKDDSNIIELKASEYSILSSIDLNKAVTDEYYKYQLELYQKQMSDLCYKLYSRRKSVVIVYEGWDAAGKGGNIKRLTEGVDPRGYEVIPIAAPTAEELNHHYLWRFYKKLPKDGHIAIFDRSWYGRVMVERIEGYCSNQEWQRAYSEINDMEKHLHNNDTIVFKFWIHIDKEEQLRRFTARQESPLKQHKITDEDWRNREKWDEYEKAVDEMLFRTNTKYAPWYIIESNNKKYARLKVLEYVTNILSKKLK